MKKLLSFVLLACLMLTLCACGASDEPTVETKAEPSIHWRKDTTGKYLNDDSVKQIITVQATTGSNAVVKLFEKTVEGDRNIWTETLCCDAFIGKEGLG